MSAAVKSTAIDAHAHAHGLCVVPIKADGSKRPDLGSWRSYQERQSTQSEIEAWFADEVQTTGLGIITGEVSGNLELFEFDDGELVARYLDEANDARLAHVVQRIISGYREQTPSGGQHWLYRLDGGETKSTVLASRPFIDGDGKQRYKPLIETKGHGGFVVIAPSHGSVHPSGRPYRLIAGGFSTITTLTPEERDALWSLARTFDEREKPIARVPVTVPHEASRWTVKPGDAFAASTEWVTILEPHGWEPVRQRGESMLWRRPDGYPGGWGASTNYGGSDLLYVWTSSAPPFEPSRAYGKFAAYALLNHDGDFTTAARALADQGFGERAPTSEQLSPSQTSIGQLVRACEQVTIPPFPLDALPPVARAFVDAGAASLRCPPDFVALPLFAFCGAAAGNSRRLQIKPGFEVLPIFWTGVIGRPGTVKTPALTLSRTLLDQLQQDSWEHYQHELNEWNETPKDERGAKPLLEHYFATDTTTQGVGYALMGSRGIAVVHDELAGWVNSFDAYHKGGDRQFWLSSWSGAPIKPNRRTGDHIFVADPVTCITGGIQPEVLPDLAGEAKRDDGFLPRLLLAWPDAPVSLWSEEVVPERVRQAMLDVVKQLRRPPDSVIVTTLSQPAKQAWIAWFNENQRLIPTQPGIAAGWAAKAPTHLARIAHVLHMLAYPGLPNQTVDLETLQHGIAILEYLRAHLTRILPVFGSHASASGTALGQRIERLLRLAAPDWLSRAELSERLGGHEDRAAIDRELAKFQEAELVERRVVATAGRPRTDWRWIGDATDEHSTMDPSGITEKDGIRVEPAEQDPFSRNPVIPYQPELTPDPSPNDTPTPGAPTQRVIWEVPE